MKDLTPYKEKASRLGMVFVKKHGQDYFKLITGELVNIDTGEKYKPLGDGGENERGKI